MEKSQPRLRKNSREIPLLLPLTEYRGYIRPPTNPLVEFTELSQYEANSFSMAMIINTAVEEELEQKPELTIGQAITNRFEISIDEVNQLAEKPITPVKFSR